MEQYQSTTDTEVVEWLGSVVWQWRKRSFGDLSNNQFPHVSLSTHGLEHLELTVDRFLSRVARAHATHIEVDLVDRDQAPLL